MLNSITGFSDFTIPIRQIINPLCRNHIKNGIRSFIPQIRCHLGIPLNFPYSFTAPDVSPPMMYLCPSRYTIMTGRQVRMISAKI